MKDDSLIKRQAFRVSEQVRPSHAVPVVPKVAIPAPMSFAAVAPARVEPVAPPPPAITPAEIARLKEEARLEGLALGRKQGQQEVESAARDRIAALEVMVTQVSAAWEAEREHMQGMLADFAFVCVNRLLGDCLHDRAMAASAVQSALAACDGWQEMTIEVHAGDLDLMQAVVSQDATLSQKALRVVASRAVQVGGCRITSDEGTLDARIEVQLAELRKQLDALRAQRKSQP